MTREQTYKVCIRCITYNHATYITAALNSFVSQITDFPYIILLIDDCSSDGEQNIVEEFISTQFNLNDSLSYERNTDNYYLRYARHNENNNCYIASIRLKYNHYSKGLDKLPYVREWRNCSEYEAICEGDDYWTDNLKLQKQVNVLDSCPEVGLVHTDFNVVRGSRRHFKFTSKSTQCLEMLLRGEYPIGTLTTMYRLSVYNSISRDWLHITPSFRMGDLPLFIELASISKFVYLSDVTAEYRILNESASHSQNIRKVIEFHQDKMRCIKYYSKKFGLPDLDANKRFYTTILRIALKAEDRDTSVAFVKEALHNKGLSFKGVVYHILVMLPMMSRLIKKLGY